MIRLWVWTAPKRVERAAGMIRCNGWMQYAPERVPAMWLRIAALESDQWLDAVAQYGPLHDTFDEQPHEESIQRDAWGQAIEALREVSHLWRQEDAGVWSLPESPVELTRPYRLVQAQLARIAGDNGVRLAVRGLELVPEPATLDAYLWLSAAESVRDRHRFKKCERCDGWFAIQRTDARFCSAVCRNKREAA